MSPRYLGASCVFVKSFARIHETNLKKQGILALTFANPDDYNSIDQEDTVSLEGLDGFAPGQPLQLQFKKKSGQILYVEANHSYNAEQIQWFRLGSSLNVKIA